MKSKFKNKILQIIILCPIFLFASIDQELIVLFKFDTIQMPNGQDTASISEIDAPQNVISCLQAIEAKTIIKAMPNFDRADTLRITEEGWEARLPDWSNLYVVDIRSDRDSAIVKLETLNAVIYAEKNEKGEPLYVTPNDTWFQDAQWNLNDHTGNIGIDIMRAWDLSKGNHSTVIAIVDLGVRTSGTRVHEDLIGKVFGDDRYSEHGTQVAGIAAALTNNNIGIAGVDWYALLNIQDYGGGSIPEFAQAVYEAAEAANIINCSWANSWGFSHTLYYAFKYAFQLNRLPVAAMPATYNSRNFPSAYGPWMVTVAGTDRNNQPASYLLERKWVDVAASGGEDGSPNGIMSPTSYQSYTANWGGTSLAAPHVSGLAGLLLNIRG